MSTYFRDGRAWLRADDDAEVLVTCKRELNEALALLRELNDALAIPDYLQPRVDAVLDGHETVVLATEKGLTPIGEVVEALTQIANWPDEDNEWDAVEKYAKVRDIAKVGLERFEIHDNSAPQEEKT